MGRRRARGELSSDRGRRGGWSARITAIENRILDRLRSPAAADVATEAPTGKLADFEGRRHCVLVTYRRDGTPVPSPLWFGVHDGVLHVHTGGAKVKRAAADPRVRVAPSTFRGRPVGPPLEATARPVPAEQAAAAEAAIQANYGLVRKLYYRTLGRGQHHVAVYLEIRPDVSPLV